LARESQVGSDCFVGTFIVWAGRGAIVGKH